MQLKLNALDFKELENKNIEELLIDCIDDLKSRITEYEKKGEVYDLVTNEKFRQYYNHTGYYKDPKFEINSKNVTFKFSPTMKEAKDIYDAETELDYCVSADNEKLVITQKDINKCKSEDWKGEFPSIVVYIVRIGNKEYSFYTVSR